MTNSFDWTYNENLFDGDITNYAGFVYIITNKINGKQYIGKKLFWSSKRKQVNKKRKSYKVESDWKEYWSSSDEVKSDVHTLGPENFKREIIHLCKTKGDLSYLELYEQVTRNVLFNENFYNGIIQCRVHHSHVKGLKEYFTYSNP